MTGDFDAVRAVASQSLAGRALRTTIAALTAAWASSIAAQSLRRRSRRFLAASPAERLRCSATALAIAAPLHLGLRALMPSTVVPALPAALMVIASVVAAGAAWQAETVERAWRHSRLSRLFDRSA
jgi:hypothetical protein